MSTSYFWPFFSTSSVPTVPDAGAGSGPAGGSVQVSASEKEDAGHVMIEKDDLAIPSMVRESPTQKATNPASGLVPSPLVLSCPAAAAIAVPAATDAADATAAATAGLESGTICVGGVCTPALAANFSKPFDVSAGASLSATQELVNRIASYQVQQNATIQSLLADKTRLEAEIKRHEITIRKQRINYTRQSEGIQQLRQEKELLEHEQRTLKEYCERADKRINKAETATKHAQKLLIDSKTKFDMHKQKQDKFVDRLVRDLADTKVQTKEMTRKNKRLLMGSQRVAKHALRVESDKEQVVLETERALITAKNRRDARSETQAESGAAHTELDTELDTDSEEHLNED